MSVYKLRSCQFQPPFASGKGIAGSRLCEPCEEQQEGRSLGSGGESVEIRSASKSFGSVRVLDNVSLHVAPREFVSLLGPSGSGKTTLLNLLGGFIQPSSGSIHFGDRDVTLEPPHKRNIGVVFQNYALFPHMSVGENVAFPLRARRLPKADWPEKVRAALAMVGLAGYEARGVAQLSGGQRQRVALARAMIFEPRLILMDEPLSALDKQLREAMQIELRELHKRIGATIIYVTHDQREALTMSDRVAILKDGRLVQIDRPEPGIFALNKINFRLSNRRRTFPGSRVTVNSRIHNVADKKVATEFFRKLNVGVLRDTGQRCRLICKGFHVRAKPHDRHFAEVRIVATADQLI